MRQARIGVPQYADLPGTRDAAPTWRERVHRENRRRGSGREHLLDLSRDRVAIGRLGLGEHLLEPSGEVADRLRVARSGLRPAPGQHNRITGLGQRKRYTFANSRARPGHHRNFACHSTTH